MTVQEFLDRYDNKEQFNEEECRDLFWGDLEDYEELKLIDEEHDENRRWSYMSYRYFQIHDRFFRFSADIGLTEYQENSYWAQPEEVTLTTETKTITVNVWERKNNG